MYHLILLKKNLLSKKFTEIYRNNGFEGTVSLSGGGPDLMQTKIIRKTLPEIFLKYEVEVFLDASCGDFYWLNTVDLSSIKLYIGVDIVKEIIRNNKKKFGKNNIRFKVTDLTKDKILKADLILCRDCLNHLSFEDSIKVIKNFQNSQSKYLLMTTFSGRTENENLYDKIWRPLNLC